MWLGKLPDTAEFNLLRVVPAKMRRAGLSFGGGAHLCLGRQLANGTPEQTQPDILQLAGQAALLARALFLRQARPDPSRPVESLSGPSRDVYHFYPILLD